jgi:5'-3' exonuclease
MSKRKVLIDGDIVAYRSAFATQDLLPKDAEEKFEVLIDYILEQCLEFPMPDDYEIYLTGKNNFRHEIAKSHVYKGNRKDTQKPIHLGHVRQYAIEKFGAIVSEGEEADDLIAIGATKYGKQTIVASIDKDMLQIPCTHFNFNRNEWTDVDEWDGLKFFYTQILTGDSADNIIGLYKVGPVKAGKILDGAESEEELWDRCVDAYDGDAERVLENARLLWLRRYEGELWQPPDMR